VVARLSVRTTAACRLFPSGEALPSTTSAGSCLPLFDRFLGTTTSSDFSSAYMLGVRLLPSRAGPAQVRARVRPPRFRTKNFTTCARPSTARGSSIQANTLWGMLPSRQRTRSAPRNSTRFAAQYSARGLPCERFTAVLADRTSCITRGRGGWLDLPRGGLAPPILCQLSWRTLLGVNCGSRSRLSQWTLWASWRKSERVNVHCNGLLSAAACVRTSLATQLGLHACAT
jgi:hypothetical protein